MIAIVATIRFVLNSAISADQPMISIVTTVRLPAVGTIMIWPVRTVTTVRTPRVIVVVISAVPVVIVNVGVVVIYDLSLIHI